MQTKIYPKKRNGESVNCDKLRSSLVGCKTPDKLGSFSWIYKLYVGKCIASIFHIAIPPLPVLNKYLRIFFFILQQLSDLLYVTGILSRNLHSCSFPNTCAVCSCAGPRVSTLWAKISFLKYSGFNSSPCRSRAVARCALEQIQANTWRRACGMQSGNLRCS